MTWRDELRPASFRGVPFLVESSEQKLGRRAVQTEYPGRDEPFPEDLGRRAWGDSLTAFVIGEDHLQQAQRLAEAINQYGPGELVHPYLGSRLVQIGEVSLRHSSREGGQSTFTIELLEAGPANTPSELPNTDTALQQSCSVAEAALSEDFEQRFSIADLPQGLIDELATRYDQALGLLDPLRRYAATGQAWANRIQTITALMSDPAALVAELFPWLGQLFGTDDKGQAHPKAEAVLDVLRRLPSVEKTRIQPVNHTPSRARQQAAQSQLLDLMQGATVISGGRASSQVEYRDQQQARQVQEAFLVAIEQAEQRASDALYRELAQVRVDLVKDLGSRGAGLPSVTRVVPEQTQPSLVLAYRLYGNSRREAELIERNQPQHPAFLPAGEPLEVVR